MIRKKYIRLSTQEQLNDFLWTVRDDLDFLAGIDYSTPTRTTVRVAASIARRLLADKMYYAAWHFVDPTARPVVEAVDLSAVVARLEPRHIQYAYAGGAPTKGAHHKGYVLLAIPKAEIDPLRAEATAQQIGSQINPPERRSFVLDEFCSSASVISGGAAISRLGMVRYVANKLGGVHWDNARGAWNDPVGSRHRLLDENHIMVGRLSAPLYEMISIAYDLSNSSDAISLRKRISDFAREPELSDRILKFREGRTGVYADMTFSPREPAADVASGNSQP